MSHWLVWADSLLSPTWVLSPGAVLGEEMCLCTSGCSSFASLYLVAVDWRILSDIFINFLPLQVLITSLPLLCEEDWWCLLWVCLLLFYFFNAEGQEKGKRSSWTENVLCSGGFPSLPPSLPLGVSPACPSAADRGFMLCNFTLRGLDMLLKKRDWNRCRYWHLFVSTGSSMVK